MKRKLNCPIMLGNLSFDNRAEYLTQLKEAGADRLFIAIERSYVFTGETRERRQMLKELSEHIRYFESEGLEVGLWINSFGFGTPMSNEEIEHSRGMTKIKSVLGKEAGDAFCPEDPLYMEKYCNWIMALAQIHPKLIMLDDDLCLSVRPGIGCFCDRHIKLLEEKVGRVLNLEKLYEEIFVGEGNALRSAWLEVMGETLRKFCRTIRETVDQVDSDIRVGFCAGYTSWDIEGADAIELTKILAGKNEPFLRYTGAPYWVNKSVNRFAGRRLHDVIEFTREQAVWSKGQGVECFTELDSYPRARYQVPAKFLECVDAAMLASDDADTLKYLFDYYSPTDYETGYLRMHKKYEEFYKFIEKHFADKKAIGIQVYECMRKIEDYNLPAGWNQKQIMTTSLPFAATVLTSLGIPVTYEENPECAIAFNNNVKSIEKMPKRMIVDAVAAKCLQEQGIDVGLVSVQALEGIVYPVAERFGDVRISAAASGGIYYECTLKEKAEVQSVLEIGDKLIPASYIYDNGTTEFLVYTFDAYSISQAGSVLCSYGRQEQILSFYSDYPIIRKSPFVYQLCKKNENETALFVANIFEDEMFDFEIELDKAYESVECYGVEAHLEGKTLKVTSEVASYGMFAVVLR